MMKRFYTRKDLVEIFQEIHKLKGCSHSAEYFQGWNNAVAACEDEFTQRTGIDVSDLDTGGEEAGDDPVNHPSHYCGGNIEVIDFIEDQDLSYHLGNAVKYICRAGKKDPSKTGEDLCKAIWYIQRYIDLMTGND